MEIQNIAIDGEGYKCHVGKTTLKNVFVHGHFHNEPDSIEDDYRKQIIVDGVPVLLQLLDVPCPEDGGSDMREQQRRSCQGFILCFAINSRQSFECIPELHLGLCRIKEAGRVPCVIAGLKSDLEDERVVAAEEARQMADNYGCEYVEVSSKLRINVDELFEEIVRKVRAGDEKKEKQCLFA